MDIVERINEKCIEKSTNINALEKSCSLGHGTIRRWSKNSPSIDKLEIVANFLSVSLEWLITGKESAILTEKEQRLIELYRSTNAQGKGSIMNNAEYCAKTMPMEQQLLTSKLG